MRICNTGVSKRLVGTWAAAAECTDTSGFSVIGVMYVDQVTTPVFGHYCVRKQCNHPG